MIAATPGRQQINFEYISLEECLFHIYKRHLIFCATYM